MTTSIRRSGDRSQPIRGAFELVQAIPYLIGYHPAESIVLVGLRRGILVVTARLDLADVASDALLPHTVARAVDGGVTEFVLVVYTEAPEVFPPIQDGLPTGWEHPDHDLGPMMTTRPGAGAASAAASAVLGSRARLLDALLVRSGRCRSYFPVGPPEGWDLTSAPSPFVAEATVAGTAPRCDRASVAASLDPYPDDVRAGLDHVLATAENAGMAAVRNDGRARHDRDARRAVLSAVRACHEPGWGAPDDAELARLAVALTSIETRDEVWLVIEAGKFDGRPLMLELARRCPPPYDVAPLFLYGWACWRAGNSMLAGEAARRAVAVNPAYTAARTLVDTVEHGVDPHRVPQLRRPRRTR